MNKRKICWITPDYFVDCDLNYFNMHEILRHYDIHWIVLFSKNNRFKEADFEQIRKENTNLTIEFFSSCVGSDSEADCIISRCGKHYPGQWNGKL